MLNSIATTLDTSIILLLLKQLTHSYCFKDIKIHRIIFYFTMK